MTIPLASNPLPRRIGLLGCALLALGGLNGRVRAEATSRPAEPPSPERGFWLLTNKPLSSPILSIDEMHRLWTVWEPALRATAERSAPEERRRMTFERYGFIEREFDASGLPLGYTADGQGNLVTNCFACHGGKVAGRSYPGLANSHQDLTTLMTDLGRLRAADRGETAPTTEAAAPLGIPLNFAKGFSNATMFSLALGAFRDKDLNLIFPKQIPKMVHNDIDAPAWWNFKHKQKIYCDAFAPPTARTLMQFTMSPYISGDTIRSWEPDFEHIRAYLQNLEPPKYPFPIDEPMALRGRKVFEQTCARCHGTYGPDGEYPHKVVPFQEIGTDPVRLGAVSREAREAYNQSWFSHYGEHPVDVESTGYLAPPLRGVWATAPYLHNGSVPTVYHLFHSGERPRLWRRTENGYDQERLGIEVEALDAVPEGLSPRERRMYYDVSVPSHGNQGHLFPEQELNEPERRWVIEYLKTL